MAHGLAHLDVPGPERLLDARYLGWVKAELPPDAWHPIASDAPLLTNRYLGAGVPVPLEAYFALHHDIESFLRVAGLPLASLEPSDVADPHCLGELARVDPVLVELFRADLALVARAYQVAYERHVVPELARGCARVAACLDQATARFPELGAASLELSFGLGCHGRALGNRIVVGAPAPWNDVTPIRCAVLATHECLVLQAAVGPTRSFAERYARSEWAALRHMAARLVGHHDEFARAHAEWLASLELEPLVLEVVRLGLIPADFGRGLIGSAQRAAQLAAIEPPVAD